MAEYHSLPNIYLGAGEAGSLLYQRVFEVYGSQMDRFPSVNQFLKYLVTYSLDHDDTLKLKKAL